MWDEMGHVLEMNDTLTVLSACHYGEFDQTCLWMWRKAWRIVKETTRIIVFKTEVQR
jgi:hypothetical protein